MFKEFKISFLIIGLLSMTAFLNPGNSVLIENNTGTSFEAHYRITRHIPEQEKFHFFVETKGSMSPQQQNNFEPNETHLAWLNKPDLPSGTLYRLSLFILADLNHHDHAYLESPLMSLEEVIDHYCNGKITVGLDDSERYTFNLFQTRSEAELSEELAPLDPSNDDHSLCSFPMVLEGARRLSITGFPSKL